MLLLALATAAARVTAPFAGFTVGAMRVTAVIAASFGVLLGAFGWHAWSRRVELVLDGDRLHLRWAGGLGRGEARSVPRAELRGVRIETDDEDCSSLLLLLERGTISLAGIQTNDDYRDKAARLRAFLGFTPE